MPTELPGEEPVEIDESLALAANEHMLIPTGDVAAAFRWRRTPHRSPAPRPARSASSSSTCARRAAPRPGLLVSVDGYSAPTEAQEAPGDAGYKASWYAAATTFIRSRRDRLYAIVFNTSNDGPGGYQPDTTTRSRSAFLTLARDPVWGY